MIGTALTVGMILAIVFFATLTVFQVVLMWNAGKELRTSLREQPVDQSRYIVRSPFSPRVSLLVPAYNEETMIVETVQSMLAIDYPHLEVVVVNDGSSDGTLDALIDHFNLKLTATIPRRPLVTKPIRDSYRCDAFPGLRVIDKENGGKADALNVALLHSSHELVCSVDADTIIEPDALERLVVPFIRDPDLLAAGGSVRPLNGCKVELGRVVERGFPTRMLAGVQSVEYARAFLFGRLGWNRLGDNIIVSGAFGMFNREGVISAGGYHESTVGEDMELILRLRRNAMDSGLPARVSFLPDPMAWTEVPEDLRALGRQRNRWQRGLLTTLWMHRKTIGRPRYGRMGILVLPYYVMELFAPVLEVIGIFAITGGLILGSSAIEQVLVLFAVVYGTPTVLSSIALNYQDLLDGTRLAPRSRRRRARWLVLEQLGFRQLTIVWRLWGFYAAIRGDGQWGAQVRHGTNLADPS